MRDASRLSRPGNCLTTERRGFRCVSLCRSATCLKECLFVAGVGGAELHPFDVGQVYAASSNTNGTAGTVVVTRSAGDRGVRPAGLRSDTKSSQASCNLRWRQARPAGPAPSRGGRGRLRATVGRFRWSGIGCGSAGRSRNAWSAVAAVPRDTSAAAASSETVGRRP